MAWEDRDHTATTSVDTGILIEMQGPSSTYIELGDILSMPPPTAFETPLIEMTHMQTPKGTREFAGGRGNPSQLQIQLGYTPGDAGQKAILGAKGQTKSFRVSYRDQPQIQTFDAVVMNWQPSPVAADGTRYEGTLTLQISGEVTETP